MADTLWEPFENNLQRWVDSLDGRIIRGVTTPEQEQQIIDNIRSTNPAGVPWATAEESPYVDGLAATVVIPPRNMDRALRTSAQYGLLFDTEMPWHVEPIGLREGVLNVPGVNKSKHLKNTSLSKEEMMARAFDRMFAKMHYADEEVVNASATKNNRRIPIDDAAKKFLRVMGSIASNNNYDAVNPDTGAVGRWQIPAKNWNKWTEQVFGQTIPLEINEESESPMAPDRLTQDRVAAGMAQSLFDKYKSWDRVAVAWRGGKAGSDKAYPDDKAFKQHFNNAWLKDGNDV